MAQTTRRRLVSESHGTLGASLTFSNRNLCWVAATSEHTHVVDTNTAIVQAPTVQPPIVETGERLPHARDASSARDALFSVLEQLKHKIFGSDDGGPDVTSHNRSPPSCEGSFNETEDNSKANIGRTSISALPGGRRGAGEYILAVSPVGEVRLLASGSAQLGRSHIFQHRVQGATSTLHLELFHDELNSLLHHVRWDEVVSNMQSDEGVSRLADVLASLVISSTEDTRWMHGVLSCAAGDILDSFLLPLCKYVQTLISSEAPTQERVVAQHESVFSMVSAVCQRTIALFSPAAAVVESAIPKFFSELRRLQTFSTFPCTKHSPRELAGAGYVFSESNTQSTSRQDRKNRIQTESFSDDSSDDSGNNSVAASSHGSHRITPFRQQHLHIVHFTRDEKHAVTNGELVARVNGIASTRHRWLDHLSVPLAKAIANLPCEKQPTSCRVYEDVEVLETKYFIATTNTQKFLALTCSASTGMMSLWSTFTGLHLITTLNCRLEPRYLTTTSSEEEEEEEGTGVWNSPREYLNNARVVGAHLLGNGQPLAPVCVVSSHNTMQGPMLQVHVLRRLTNAFKSEDSASSSTPSYSSEEDSGVGDRVVELHQTMLCRFCGDHSPRFSSVARLSVHLADKHADVTNMPKNIEFKEAKHVADMFTSFMFSIVGSVYIEGSSVDDHPVFCMVGIDEVGDACLALCDAASMVSCCDTDATTSRWSTTCLNEAWSQTAVDVDAAWWTAWDTLTKVLAWPTNTELHGHIVVVSGAGRYVCVLNMTSGAVVYSREFTMGEFVVDVAANDERSTLGLLLSDGVLEEISLKEFVANWAMGEGKLVDLVSPPIHTTPVAATDVSALQLEQTLASLQTSKIDIASLECNIDAICRVYSSEQSSISIPNGVLQFTEVFQRVLDTKQHVGSIDVNVTLSAAHFVSSVRLEATFPQHAFSVGHPSLVVSYETADGQMVVNGQYKFVIQKTKSASNTVHAWAKIIDGSLSLEPTRRVVFTVQNLQEDIPVVPLTLSVYMLGTSVKRVQQYPLAYPRSLLLDPTNALAFYPALLDLAQQENTSLRLRDGSISLMGYVCCELGRKDHAAFVVKHADFHTMVQHGILHCDHPGPAKTTLFLLRLQVYPFAKKKILSTCTSLFPVVQRMCCTSHRMYEFFEVLRKVCTIDLKTASRNMIDTLASASKEFAGELSRNPLYGDLRAYGKGTEILFEEACFNVPQELDANAYDGAVDSFKPSMFGQTAPVGFVVDNRSRGVTVFSPSSRTHVLSQPMHRIIFTAASAVVVDLGRPVVLTHINIHVPKQCPDLAVFVYCGNCADYIPETKLFSCDKLGAGKRIITHVTPQEACRYLLIRSEIVSDQHTFPGYSMCIPGVFQSRELNATLYGYFSDDTSADGTSPWVEEHIAQLAQTDSFAQQEVARRQKQLHSAMRKGNVGSGGSHDSDHSGLDAAIVAVRESLAQAHCARWAWIRFAHLNPSLGLKAPPFLQCSLSRARCFLEQLANTLAQFGPIDYGHNTVNANVLCDIFQNACVGQSSRLRDAIVKVLQTMAVGPRTWAQFVLHTINSAMDHPSTHALVSTDVVKMLQQLSAHRGLTDASPRNPLLLEIVSMLLPKIMAKRVPIHLLERSFRLLVQFTTADMVSAPPLPAAIVDPTKRAKVVRIHLQNEGKETVSFMIPSHTVLRNLIMTYLSLKAMSAKEAHFLYKGYAVDTMQSMASLGIPSDAVVHVVSNKESEAGGNAEDGVDSSTALGGQQEPYQCGVWFTTPVFPGLTYAVCQSPSATAAVLATVPPGARLHAHQFSNEWVYVEYRPQAQAHGGGSSDTVTHRSYKKMHTAAIVEDSPVVNGWMRYRVGDVFALQMDRFSQLWCDDIRVRLRPTPALLEAFGPVGEDTWCTSRQAVVASVLFKFADKHGIQPTAIQAMVNGQRVGTYRSLASVDGHATDEFVMHVDVVRGGVASEAKFITVRVKGCGPARMPQDGPVLAHGNFYFMKVALSSLLGNVRSICGLSVGADPNMMMIQHDGAILDAGQTVQRSDIVDMSTVEILNQACEQCYTPDETEFAAFIAASEQAMTQAVAESDDDDFTDSRGGDIILDAQLEADILREERICQLPNDDDNLLPAQLLGILIDPSISQPINTSAFTTVAETLIRIVDNCSITSLLMILQHAELHNFLVYITRSGNTSAQTVLWRLIKKVCTAVRSLEYKFNSSVRLLEPSVLHLFYDVVGNVVRDIVHDDADTMESKRVYIRILLDLLVPNTGAAACVHPAMDHTMHQMVYGAKTTGVRVPQCCCCGRAVDPFDLAKYTCVHEGCDLTYCTSCGVLPLARMLRGTLCDEDLMQLFDILGTDTGSVKRDASTYTTVLLLLGCVDNKLALLDCAWWWPLCKSVLEAHNPTMMWQLCQILRVQIRLGNCGKKICGAIVDIIESCCSILDTDSFRGGHQLVQLLCEEWMTVASTEEVTSAAPLCLRLLNVFLKNYLDLIGEDQHDGRLPWLYVLLSDSAISLNNLISAAVQLGGGCHEYDVRTLFDAESGQRGEQMPPGVRQLLDVISRYQPEAELNKNIKAAQALKSDPTAGLVYTLLPDCCFELPSSTTQSKLAHFCKPKLPTARYEDVVSMDVAAVAHKIISLSDSAYRYMIQRMHTLGTLSLSSLGFVLALALAPRKPSRALETWSVLENLTNEVLREAVGSMRSDSMFIDGSASGKSSHQGLKVLAENTPLEASQRAVQFLYSVHQANEAVKQIRSGQHFLTILQNLLALLPHCLETATDVLVAFAAHDCNLAPVMLEKIFQLAFTNAQGHVDAYSSLVGRILLVVERTDAFDGCVKSIGVVIHQRPLYVFAQLQPLLEVLRDILRRHKTIPNAIDSVRLCGTLTRFIGSIIGDYSNDELVVSPDAIWQQNFTATNSFDVLSAIKTRSCAMHVFKPGVRVRATRTFSSITRGELGVLISVAAGVIWDGKPTLTIPFCFDDVEAVSISEEKQTLGRRGIVCARLSPPDEPWSTSHERAFGRIVTILPMVGKEILVQCDFANELPAASSATVSRSRTVGKLKMAADAVLEIIYAEDICTDLQQERAIVSAIGLCVDLLRYSPSLVQPIVDCIPTWMATKEDTNPIKDVVGSEQNAPLAFLVGLFASVNHSAINDYLELHGMIQNMTVAMETAVSDTTAASLRGALPALRFWAGATFDAFWCQKLDETISCESFLAFCASIKEFSPATPYGPRLVDRIHSLLSVILQNLVRNSSKFNTCLCASTTWKSLPALFLGYILTSGHQLSSIQETALPQQDNLVEDVWLSAEHNKACNHGIFLSRKEHFKLHDKVEISLARPDGSTSWAGTVVAVAWKHVWIANAEHHCYIFNFDVIRRRGLRIIKMDTPSIRTPKSDRHAAPAPKSDLQWRPTSLSDHNGQHKFVRVRAVSGDLHAMIHETVQMLTTFTTGVQLDSNAKYRLHRLRMLQRAANATQNDLLACADILGAYLQVPGYVETLLASTEGAMLVLGLLGAISPREMSLGGSVAPIEYILHKRLRVLFEDGEFCLRKDVAEAILESVLQRITGLDSANVNHHGNLWTDMLLDGQIAGVLEYVPPQNAYKLRSKYPNDENFNGARHDFDYDASEDLSDESDEGENRTGRRRPLIPHVLLSSTMLLSNESFYYEVRLEKNAAYGGITIGFHQCDVSIGIATFDTTTLPTHGFWFCTSLGTIWEGAYLLGQPCGPVADGDVVGCGLDAPGGIAYFTKNGVIVGVLRCDKDKAAKFSTAVCIHGSTAFRVICEPSALVCKPPSRTPQALLKAASSSALLKQTLASALMIPVGAGLGAADAKKAPNTPATRGSARQSSIAATDDSSCEQLPADLSFQLHLVRQVLQVCKRAGVQADHVARLIRKSQIPAHVKDMLSVDSLLTISRQKPLYTELLFLVEELHAYGVPIHEDWKTRLMVLRDISRKFLGTLHKYSVRSAKIHATVDSRQSSSGPDSDETASETSSSSDGGDAALVFGGVAGNHLIANLNSVTESTMAKHFIAACATVMEEDTHGADGSGANSATPRLEAHINPADLDKQYADIMGTLRTSTAKLRSKPSTHFFDKKPSASSTPLRTQHLMKEFADASCGLPVNMTNAIFVCCDEDRMDLSKVLITGAADTPYDAGCFVFDVFCPERYPSEPPLVQLVTHGNERIQFNPNLYASGKVCLSLLGTWEGETSECWNEQSTLMQVYSAIQSLIMTNNVYYNEPALADSDNAAALNRGYRNIVRYGTVKYAMVEQLMKPEHCFRGVIRKHFFLQKDRILETCEKWLAEAASSDEDVLYTELVSAHNPGWAKLFSGNTNAYMTALEEAVAEIRSLLEALGSSVLSTDDSSTDSNSSTSDDEAEDASEDNDSTAH